MMMERITWQCGRFQLDLSAPKVMGIVNATPDSFSDGGVYSQTVRSALLYAEKLLQAGADILDVGGESTRPGSDYVPPEEEWRRVAPVLAELAQWRVPLSLDTRRTEVMRWALDAGYPDIINDVAALSDEGAVALLAAHENIGICLMHMQGLPENMQENPQYGDVVREVVHYLNERVAVCKQAGIAQERLILDPGFGFGKTLPHNIALMQGLADVLQQCGLPLLIGVSRKRMIGELSVSNIASERVGGSVAAALAAVARGAQVVRVHDVRETVEAVRVWQALGGRIG